jgi:hypothetical protein
LNKPRLTPRTGVDPYGKGELVVDLETNGAARASPAREAAVQKERRAIEVREDERKMQQRSDQNQTRWR